MSTIMEYIKTNDLAWQPSFNGVLSNDFQGYRGALIVEEGKAISPDRKLPPKVQARQVIMLSDDNIKFLACELENFSHLELMFDKYKDYFCEDGFYILFVTDLEKDATFTYNNIKFTAYVLDESSVWNELLELADLEKSYMKKLSSEDKIVHLYDELLDNFSQEESKTYEEMLGFVGESSKQLMGAV